MRVRLCAVGRLRGGPEAALIDVLARAGTEPEVAHLLLADLLGTRRADGVLASAAALAAAFADAGRPIGG